MPDDAPNPPAATPAPAAPAAPKRTPLHKVAYGLNGVCLALLLPAIVLHLIYWTNGSLKLWNVAAYLYDGAFAFGVLALIVEGILGSREKAEALAKEQGEAKANAKDQA